MAETSGTLSSTTPACNHLGFLSVFEEANGFVGGYLVTNAWGRPLEFRISSAVQPTKVQQVLYGETLRGYVCGEIIGKTLVEKAATAVEWLLVDSPAVLDVRFTVAVPVALWYPLADPDQSMPGLIVQDRIYCHSHFSQDVDALRNLIGKLGSFDFAEPFVRIREAAIEARKMGVTMRRAA